MNLLKWITGSGKFNVAAKEKSLFEKLKSMSPDERLKYWLDWCEANPVHQDEPETKLMDTFISGIEIGIEIGAKSRQ